MSNFNLAVIVGRMVADPDIRYTQKGAALVRFTLAVNRTWKTSEGANGEEVSFIEFEVWGRLAETISQHFRKGHAILVQGRLKQNVWEDKETKQKRSKIVVVVESFQFIEAKREKNVDEELMPQKPETRQVVEDDVPF